MEKSVVVVKVKRRNKNQWIFLGGSTSFLEKNFELFCHLNLSANLRYKRYRTSALLFFSWALTTLWSLARQGRNEWGTIPRALNHNGGAKSLRETLNDCRGRKEVPTMSEVLSSVQYICFRKISGSNLEAANLLPAPGAI